MRIGISKVEQLMSSIRCEHHQMGSFSDDHQTRYHSDSSKYRAILQAYLPERASCRGINCAQAGHARLLIHRYVSRSDIEHVAIPGRRCNIAISTLWTDCWRSHRSSPYRPLAEGVPLESVVGAILVENTHHILLRPSNRRLKQR